MSKTVAPLMAAIQANVPVLVIGEPGTGKTAITEGIIAPQMGMRCETVIASIRDVTDFSGLPIVREDGVTMAPPGFAKRILESNTPTLLFFDEISTAPPACQAGVLRIINERWCGDTPLPDTCRIVAAMNPAHTSAGGGELSAPLANRFCHLQWSVDSKAWVDWVVGRSQSHVTIGGYIRSKPQSLLSVPKNESDLGKPWPSPRTWDMAGKLMEANMQVGGTRDTEIMLVSGCVGEGQGLEFLNWRSKLDLPDPEVLLKSPEKWKVPERGDIAFTVLASVTQAVVNKTTKERYLAAWRIFNIAATNGKKDIAAGSVQLIACGSGKAWTADKDIEKELKAMLVPFIQILEAAGKIKA